MRPKLPYKSRLLASLAAPLVGVALCAPVVAEELKMAPVPEAASTDRPSRGMSMDKVEARFGAPAQRVPAVGQPPITRWEYPSFVVYFENDRVLHSVVRLAS